MKWLRYWLSGWFLEWGTRLIPDDYPKMKVQMALGLAADSMIRELEVFEGDDDNEAS